MHFFVRARVKHKRLAVASGVSLATATPRSLMIELTATPKRAKLKVKYDHNEYIKIVLNMNYVHCNRSLSLTFGTHLGSVWAPTDS